MRLNSGLACRRIEFETPLFKGCAVIWAQGLPSTPKGLFDGKRRKTSITIQGRFKQELAFEDVVTGQEFGRPAQNLPAKWLVETVLIKARALQAPSSHFCLKEIWEQSRMTMTFLQDGADHHLSLSLSLHQMLAPLLLQKAVQLAGHPSM